MQAGTGVNVAAKLPSILTSLPEPMLHLRKLQVHIIHFFMNAV